MTPDAPARAHATGQAPSAPSPAPSPAPPPVPSPVPSAPPRGHRQLLRLAGPVVVVLVAVAFAGRLATAGSAPPAERVAAVVEEPCSVLTLQEVGVLLGGMTLKDLVPDHHGGFSVCSYLGLPGAGIDVVEVGIASDDSLAVEGSGSAADVFRAAVDEAGRESTQVAGLGDEAVVLPLGVGEVWVRAGETLVRASVTRTGPAGDADAASVIARAFLAKLGAR